MRCASALAVSLACVFALAACASVAPRSGPAATPTHDQTGPASTVPERRTPQPTRAPKPAVAQAASSPPEVTLWDRLRRGFAFSTCSASPEAVRWQRTYTRGARRLTQNLDRSLPSLLYVLEQIERRGLPTEFSLLPIVESWYVPVRSNGNRPAGIWQIMPVTGRHLGLEISNEYDGRLDLAASTRSALDLIEHLANAFDRDWRLVNMGYNAGEFRVRRALPRAVRADGTVRYNNLPVSRTTHEHLAKLEALACIVRKPESFGVVLPPVDRQKSLVAITLDAALDIELAAQLAAMPTSDFRWLNPGPLGPTLRAHHSVLLPARSAVGFARLLELVPATQRTGWERTTVPGPTAWATLARGAGPDADILAAIHHARDVASPARGSILLRLPAPAAAPRESAQNPRKGRYAVLAGDSLWRIARRFGVALESLLGWNGLDAVDVLVPGQLLWVIEPRP